MARGTVPEHGMEHEFWQRRWREGATGWHRDDVNPRLARYCAQVTGGQPTTVLVPLCGKSIDMVWLAEQGHAVVGVERVEQPIREYFAEAGVSPEIETIAGLTRYRAGGVTLWHADVLKVHREHVDGVRCTFDRGALIALPPDVRARYAPHIVGLLPKGGRILLIALSFDQARVDGPPFSVPPKEVESLYGGRCDIELIESAQDTDPSPKFIDAGIDHIDQHVWMLTVR